LIIIPTDCEPYNSIESDIIANIEDLSEVGLTESQLGRGGGGGQSLLEPGSATEDAAAEDAGAEEATDAGGSSTQTATSNVVPNEIYIIQWGDSLIRIARSFNADAACLMRVNQIFNPDLIYAGNQLLITAQCRLA
jgi:LysM repeat protein